MGPPKIFPSGARSMHRMAAVLLRNFPFSGFLSKEAGKSRQVVNRGNDCNKKVTPTQVIVREALP